MWKVRIGLMCVVNSVIFETSFFSDFIFLASFLRVQCSTSRTSMTIARTRETARAVAERIMVNFDSGIRTGTTPFSSVTI